MEPCKSCHTITQGLEYLNLLNGALVNPDIQPPCTGGNGGGVLRMESVSLLLLQIYPGTLLIQLVSNHLPEKKNYLKRAEIRRKNMIFFTRHVSFKN